MADTLRRLTYDTTIPEAVDVAWRLAYRTRAFRKQLRNNVIYAGVGAGLVFFAAWMYIVGTSALNVVLASVAATLFAIVLRPGSASSATGTSHRRPSGRRFVTPRAGSQNRPALRALSNPPQDLDQIADLEVRIELRPARVDDKVSSRRFCFRGQLRRDPQARSRF